MTPEKIHCARYKYPKTPHLPYSPGLKNDDTMIDSSVLTTWIGKQVVVTEKMDGENTTLYQDGLHARSIDSKDHPSRSKVKALHGAMHRSIPASYRICGENISAVHSIRYEDLPSCFMAFSIWRGEECMSWSFTEEYCKMLGLHTVPVLFRGSYNDFIQLSPGEIRDLSGRPDNTEGYVVRLAEGFHMRDFRKSVAKYVRKDHIQTDEHWMSKPVEWNGIKREED